MEKGHVPIKRGVSWSPGGLRKPLQLTENSHIHEEDCNASWEKTGLNKEHTSRKTNLSRSASLSEKELREARVRSHIIAAQLTIPSNSGSCSRGVQLFNRRKQRVNAFTLESCGRGTEQEKDGRNKPSTNKLTWAEKSSEDKEGQSCKNFKPLSSPTISEHSVGDIMDDQAKDFPKEEDMGTSVIQERHFLPVKEEQEEEEEARDEIEEELENIKQRMSPVVVGNAGKEAGANPSHSVPVGPGKLPNGCYSTSEPEMMPLTSSKHATSIINRTARPFFSPTPTHEVKSPIMDIPSPPSYSTPPLPASVAPEYSPLPPAPTYPTPPLPMFTKQSQPSFYSSPPPLSPTMSCSSPVPVSQYPPVSHCAPPTAPKPSTFVPVSAGERKQITQIKTGILEDGAARRATKKTMFTFKEKPVVAPNPELLSLVQGVDERKKHGNRSVPEPASEEELLALGAEASNFLSKEEDKAKGAKAPEWASCLKSSRTRPRVEHQPEQTLTNVSGKGAELFAKRQSRMEKYIIENQKAGQMRSPSPTMSLPPSWVYPSNMPGRVKAIAKNSDISVQLSQNMKAQQAVRQKPKPKAVAPEPVPEPPPLENGCSKIEMDLSRHRPYQLNSSLFTFNPVKDPVSTLPRGAPRANNLVTGHALSRQTSLPSPSPTHFTIPVKSAQLPFRPQKGPEHASNPDFGTQRISSPMSPTSPEKASSSQSAVQAPRPTFSAKKAGITPQVSMESPSGEMTNETSTFTSVSTLPRRFSSPATGIWSQTNKSSTASSDSIRPLTSPVTSPSTARYQSNTNHQDIPFSTSTAKASATPTSPRSPWSSRCQSPMVSPPVKGHSPVSPPWSSRCQSPMASQNSKPSAVISCSISRPSLACTDTFPSPPWESGVKAPQQSHNTQSPALSTSTSRPFQASTSSAWGSRSQSPAPFHRSSISTPTKNLTYTSSATSPSPQPTGNRCMSPISNNLDSRANHRLLAKNIINAAKRKNSPSPGALSGHSLPISPLGNHDCHKPPISPFHSRALGAQSPVFTSPPPTPTQRICSPVRFYNSRSLTDSDASIESEDSGLRSPGLHSYNTCPRGWGGSLRVKRSTISTDL
ncbi:Synaptopodin [Oryzias melastigma]|uniref:Synaptopodin n=1 Tax=Oryzias melastigma TaxID=30732 RepID=A0A834CF85_ORYME|nr:Synaptopodin [Oryzias melastigma]